jgi:hypothetical protein
MKALLASSLIGAMSILGVAESVQALSIRGAASVTSTLGTFFGSPDAAINKNGLLNPYTDGEDLQLYLNESPQHTFITRPGNEYFSNQGITTGSLTFNLGALFNVSSLVLWNEESQGINQFRVVTSNTSNFAVSSVGGTFNAPDNANDGNYTAQQYTFAPRSAQFVRLEILSAFVDTAEPLLAVGVGEVAFGADPIITPGPVNQVPFEFSPALGVAALGVVFGAKKFLKAKVAN